MSSGEVKIVLNESEPNKELPRYFSFISIEGKLIFTIHTADEISAGEFIRMIVDPVLKRNF